MADAAAIRAGNAQVEASLEDSKLTAGLASAKARLISWGHTISGLMKPILGGIGIGSIVGSLSVADFVSAASELGKFSQRTGIAVEDLSALSYAARRSGADAGELEHGIRHMQKALFEAGEGGEHAVRALLKLGVPLQELQGLSPDKQIERLADAFKATKDPTEQAALAMRLFGRGGTELLPFLQKGSSGIEELKEQAYALGIVMKEEDIKAAREFKGIMAQLSAMTVSFSLAMGRAVLPMLTKVAHWLGPKLAFAAQVFAMGIQVVGRIFQTTFAIIGDLLSGTFGAFTGQAMFLGRSLSDAWNNFVNIIKAGDAELAFQVVVKGFRLLWVSTIIEIKGAWYDLLRWLADNPVSRLAFGDVFKHFTEIKDHALAGLRAEFLALRAEINGLLNEAARKAEEGSKRAKSKLVPPGGAGFAGAMRMEHAFTAAQARLLSGGPADKAQEQINELVNIKGEIVGLRQDVQKVGLAE